MINIRKTKNSRYSSGSNTKEKNLLANITIDTTVEFGEPTGPTKIDVPFKVVEQMPVYGKGDKDLFSYLGKKLNTLNTLKKLE